MNATTTTTRNALDVLRLAVVAAAFAGLSVHATTARAGIFDAPSA